MTYIFEKTEPLKLIIVGYIINQRKKYNMTRSSFDKEILGSTNACSYIEKGLNVTTFDYAKNIESIDVNINLPPYKKKLKSQKTRSNYYVNFNA